MKIAVVSSGLGHVSRGIETWANDLGGALHRRDIDVTLFKGGGTATRPFERVVRCAQRDQPLARTLGRFLRHGGWRLGIGSPYNIEQTTFALRFIPMVRAGQYDIVHLQDTWLALLLERTRWFHGAHVILAHGTEEPVEHLNKFTHVQELSPYYLQRHEPLENRRWFAIPNFVNVENFAHHDRAACRQVLGLPAEAFLVLSVGALRRSRKRMDWLVKEFATLEMTDAQLLIAGATEAETAGFVAEARASLGNRVTIYENLPHEQMSDLYSAADVFVLCSLEEILGIAFLEAMACGIPCIGHTYPVTQWVIGDGGDCVDMTHPGSLTSALTHYRAAKFRAEKSARAREQTVRVFSEDVVVRQIIEMYREILQTGDHRPQTGESRPETQDTRR